MTLEQHARDLAQKLAPLHEWLHDGTPWHEPGSRLEATVVTVLKEVERAALERAAHWHDEKCHRSRMRARDISGSNLGALMAQSRFEYDAQIHEQSATAIRALIDTPASEAPDPRDAEIKRHTLDK